LDYKIILGAIAIVIGLGAFIPYYVDLIKNRTKPHAFSWLIWGILLAIAFSAQIIKGGGIGAYVAGADCLGCFSIFIIALFRGEKEIAAFDIVCLILALIGVFMLVAVKQPLLAVIITAFVDFIGFVPTFRKSFKKPYEETISTFVLSSLSFLISLFALQSFNLTTALYPASIVLTNSALVVMVLFRRSGISQKKRNRR
jgi:hypothetical protein